MSLHLMSAPLAWDRMWHMMDAARANIAAEETPGSQQSVSWKHSNRFSKKLAEMANFCQAKVRSPVSMSLPV